MRHPLAPKTQSQEHMNRSSPEPADRLVRILPPALIFLLFFPAAVVFAEDPIHEMCTSQNERPAPWCYQEEVEKIGDPDLCENILLYWPKAEGVHGQCYYQLAVKNRDCSLCRKIKAQDLRRMCELDACR